MKTANRLGLNAKQQGYSCIFYSNGVAVETLSMVPQPTPSRATTTPSLSPTTAAAAAAAPTKTGEITRKTK